MTLANRPGVVLGTRFFIIASSTGHIQELLMMWYMRA